MPASFFIADTLTYFKTSSLQPPGRFCQAARKSGFLHSRTASRPLSLRVIRCLPVRCQCGAPPNQHADILRSAPLVRAGEARRATGAIVDSADPLQSGEIANERSGGHSSGIPALRRSAKKVASYRARAFGTPCHGPGEAFRRAIVEKQSPPSSLLASASAVVARSVSSLRV